MALTIDRFLCYPSQSPWTVAVVTLVLGTGTKENDLFPLRKICLNIQKSVSRHFREAEEEKKKNNNYMKTSVEASCNLSEQQFFLPINGLLQCCSKQLAVAFLTGSLIEWNQGASGQPRGFSAATFNGTGSLSLQINLPELNGQLQRRIAKDRACE